ncbi:leucine-rich repeat domain-containing protein [Pseudomarimonas arenosa]|uniref:Disease resistance R13L4/SHOC-2-like LRR domain-containing protein n=1 Tax=Pseudomarimonas arenosa TaxID=2774145 RepID=A0AAW3ZW36_9GAMM|nr:hypothetical protein [Pseudomarimonas arenosa]MBD8528246.1 hypothetical protein [Pseudomarimonas arenosa]
MRAIASAIVLLLLLALPCSARAGNLSVLLCNNVNVDLFDCFDLVVLYNSTNGDNWINNSNWGTPDVDSWHGVIVNPLTGRVIALDLALNGLNGPFPPEWRGLQALEFLQLSSNGIDGELPSYLGNLTALKLLQIGFNNLEGPLPASLGNLTQLDNLFLGGNRFSGQIPATFGNLTQLEVLNLFSDGFDAGERLSGPLPDLSGLTRLQRLDLRSNDIEGPLPGYLDQMPDLEQLHLDGNSFSGSLPANIGLLSKLQSLDLAGNQLSGAIPASLGNLAMLEELELSFNDFSSTLPTSLGNLSALRKLRIAGAPVGLLADRQAITGPIPHQLANLSQLEELNLGFNQLSGRLPACLGNLPALTVLNLQANDIEGPVPDAFTLLDLDVFYVGANLLESDTGQQLVLSPSVQTWFNAIPETVAIIPGFGFLSSTTQRALPMNPDAIFNSGFEAEPSNACG